MILFSPRVLRHPRVDKGSTWRSWGLRLANSKRASMPSNPPPRHSRYSLPHSLTPSPPHPKCLFLVIHVINISSPSSTFCPNITPCIERNCDDDDERRGGVHVTESHLTRVTCLLRLSPPPISPLHRLAHHLFHWTPRWACPGLSHSSCLHSLDLYMSIHS